MHYESIFNRISTISKKKKKKEYKSLLTWNKVFTK